MSPEYGELRLTSGWDRFVSLRHPCKIQRVSRLDSVTARHCSSGHQPNFAALNRGRHLYSAGRPSRWALAHISSSVSSWTCMVSSEPGKNLQHKSLGSIGWLEFNVPFQHKYGYIRDEVVFRFKLYVLIGSVRVPYIFLRVSSSSAWFPSLFAVGLQLATVVWLRAVFFTTAQVLHDCGLQCLRESALTRLTGR